MHGHELVSIWLEQDASQYKLQTYCAFSIQPGGSQYRAQRRGEWFPPSSSDWRSLGPMHTRRRSVGFPTARKRRYKILLLRPLCGVCAAQQLVFIFVALRQKHTTRGIELILFWRMTPGVDQLEQAQGWPTPTWSKHRKCLIPTRTIILFES